MQTISQSQYVNMGGQNCPRCNDRDIEGGSVEIDGPIAWQNINCVACGLEWTDQYELTAIDNVFDGKTQEEFEVTG